MTLPTVGIVGAGQLARMMYQAAIPLGIPVKVLAATPADAAARIARDVTVGAPDSLDVLRAFAASCDVITFDHELIVPDHLRALEQEGVTVRPGAATAAAVVDKREQRAAMRRLGAPVPRHDEVRTASEALAFARAAGWPIVIKRARGGYDGRGVRIVSDEDELRTVMRELQGAPLLAEEFCEIDAEFAVQVARRPGGETAVYPAVDTFQRDGMFHESVAPSALPAAITAAASEIARALADELQCAGMLAAEFFVVGGRVVTNELAARPHNTAHYTIEGCVTSQFENHLRAVCDLPLGSTALTAAAVATVNIIGSGDRADPADTLPDMLAIEGAHVHLYGKTPRAGRKLGHVTVCAAEREEAFARARAAAARAAAFTQGAA